MKTKTEHDPLLTPGQVAESLGIPRREVFALIQEGRLPVVPGLGRRFRIRRSDLLKFAPSLVDARRSGRGARAKTLLSSSVCFNKLGERRQRRFDGHPYVSASAWQSQETAQAEALRLRCAGRYARVTRELAPLWSWTLRRPPRPAERTFWAVWESEG